MDGMRCDCCYGSRVDAHYLVAHLKEVNRGYWSHAGHASRLGFLLFRAGVAGMVHSVVPLVFADKMSKSVAIAKHVIRQDDQRIKRKKRNG